jgi:hypothetical protein
MAQGRISVRMRDQIERQRTRRRGRVAAGFAALTLGGGMLLLPAMTASAAAPPTAYGADTVGKALYQVYNAVAQVDPSLPGSRSAVQVDPSASPPILLTTYGYANDPGTLVGAVAFAPGNPTTPSNTPGLAEAFYPEPDQEHVSKCAANNDATDAQRSSACDSANTGTWSATADASPKAKLGPSARGFAQEGGPNIAGTPFGAKHLSSESNITPDNDGNLIVIQENKGSDIPITGTPVTVSNFEASSHLKATAAAVTGDAICTINVTIAGQPIPLDQVPTALAGVGAVPGAPFSFQFAPPTAPVVTEDSLGGSASCTGATLQVTDNNTGSSVTYVFGTTVSRAARLGQTLSAAGDDQPAAASATSGGDGSSFSSSSDGSSFSSPASSDTGSSSTPIESAAPAPSETQQAAAPAAAPRAPTFNEPKLITKKINAVPVGIVTALGSIGVLLGSWLLLSSVAGLGQHGIRLSGWTMRQ